MPKTEAAADQPARGIDPTILAAIRSLTPSQIADRLDELAAEQAALTELLRALRRRDGVRPTSTRRKREGR